MKFIYTIAFSIIFLTKCFSSLAVNNSLKSNFQITVFKDSSDTIRIEMVKTILEGNSKLFIPADSMHGPFSIKGTYWLYLQPLMANNNQEYVLGFHMFLSLIEVYPYPFSSISGYGGLTVPGRLKALSGSNLLLEPGVKGYLVKVQNRVWSTGSIKNIEITPSQVFLKKKEKQDLLQAFLQGFFWLMLFYNLSLYFLVKKSIHLYYVIYVFLNSLFFFFLFGYSEVYIFPNSYRLNLIFWTFQLVGSFFYIMFIRMALINHCTTFTPAIDRKFFLPYIYIRLLMNLTAAVTVYYRMDTFTMASGLCNLIGTITGICIFLYFYKGSDWFMRIIITGSVILILFGWASLIYVRYYLHSNNLFFELGMLIELLLFTYALNKQHLNNIKKRYKAELINSKLENELEGKNRELVFQAMQLSAKEEAIATIKGKIKELDASVEPGKLIIANILGNSLNNDNLWKEFEVHFNKTHPGFYKILMDKYPELTQSEVRLCAFLKLNLNTKEIAMITQKTPRSIEVMRSRIRQKMDINRDDNLNYVLTQLQ